eukprot:TRINITY_DN9436_c0_g1_i2.p1 TRINITY_DN9436_c0_g1~~TRINITY_DN9436_c0_g1_i2.p1  ORF type:complete len:448 (-),score=101.49 TRINITY_DN9436_c0_g1_i2:37-1380(-)
MKLDIIPDISYEDHGRIFQQITGEKMPSGLVNFGNSCYMNATLHLFRKISDFRKALESYKPNPYGHKIRFLPEELKELFKQMDEAEGRPVRTNKFANLFFELRPEFYGDDTEGPSQQDAEEFFQKLIDDFSAFGLCSLSNTNTIQGTHPLMMPHFMNGQLHLQPQAIPNHLFQMSILHEWHCLEDDTYPVETSKDLWMKVNTIVLDTRGEVSENIQEGLEKCLSNEIQKYTHRFNRDTRFLRKSSFDSLPSYLVIQQMLWERKRVLTEEGEHFVREKIMKTVKFPRVLDLYPFCSSSLKTRLDYGRVLQQKRFGEFEEKKQKEFNNLKEEATLKNGGIVDEKLEAELWSKLEAQAKRHHDEELYRAPGTGTETGMYELIGLITHQGYSMNSGHYVAWTHLKEDYWVKYDDDNVTAIRIEDILNLRGVEDSHAPYICLLYTSPSPRDS